MDRSVGAPAAGSAARERERGAGPTTLAAWLRDRTDAELTALLTRRPDLATPPPADVSVLAARAGNRVSVTRALERVDAFALQVCEAMSLLAPPGSLVPVGIDELIAFFCGTPPADSGEAIRAAVARSVGRLRSLALVWGPDDDLRLAGAVADLVDDRPLGLGRPLRAGLGSYREHQLGHVIWSILGEEPPTTGVPVWRRAQVDRLVARFGDPVALRVLVDECSEAAQGILARLAEGPPLGTTGDAVGLTRAERATTPVEELLARALLVIVDAQTVELPREVGLLLRGSRPAGSLLVPEPPALTGRDVGTDAVDGAVALAAAETVRRVTTLVESWDANPVVPLRAGGLGVRDLKTAARLLEVTEPVAALIVELAYSAGLVGLSQSADAALVPTTTFDRWCADDLARRWAALAAAWLDTPRVPGLTGERDDKGKPVAAMSTATRRSGAPEIRRAVLAVLAEAPPGLAPDRASVHARLAWHTPRWGGHFYDRLVDWTFDEAGTLGITGREALGRPARILVEGREPWLTGDTDSGAFDSGAADQVEAADSDEVVDAVADALGEVLPEPVDEVIVQADLTVVAPGPLIPSVSAELAMIADIESTGAATVYRVSEGSVRRALDDGRSAADLHDFFGRVARGSIPSTLSYLIDDVARRHGLLRAGPAASYLRCDDPALLAEVVASRRTQALGLRRIAPTIVISPLAVAKVLDGLRAAGYAPAPEGPDGRIVLARPEPNRAPPRPPVTRIDPFTGRPGAARDVVRMIRRGEQTARTVRAVAAAASGGAGADGTWPAPGTARTPDTILSALGEAVRLGRRALLDYVDPQGTRMDRVVVPTAVGGGFLFAWDEREQASRQFLLHRVAGALVLDDAFAGESIDG